MALRDLLIFVAVFAALPFVLRRPWLGVLLWIWLSVMNPHRLSWGVAYDFPFAQVVAIFTLGGLLFSKDPIRLKGGAPAATLFVFVAWMCVTTVFALVPSAAQLMLERVLKIQVFTFVALLALSSRRHVNALIWTLVISIGYYSVKGGLFTITSGGQYRVWGPPDSFIFDNNALAVAVVMSIPLWMYVYQLQRAVWLRLAVGAAMILSVAAALGSQSRGALLAMLAMAFVLWLRTRSKMLPAAAIVLVGFSLVFFMPETWSDRMMTINAESEERDASAQGRLDAWSMLTNLALDRPLVGGGFEPYSHAVWDQYHPNYAKPYSAHSIYFSALGEHGFVGLGLFLAIWGLTWNLARRLASDAAGRADRGWAYSLARLAQASLVAYLVGGAFLDLAYWDGPYYLMVALAVARNALRAEQAALDNVGVSDRRTEAMPVGESNKPQHRG